MSRQMQKTQKPAHKPVRHGDRRGRLVRVGACTLAGLLAALMLLSVVFSALPIRAASQSAVDALRQELSETSERKKEIEAELSPEASTGPAPQQVEEYLRDVIQPVLDANPEDVGMTAELSV